jgi:Gas vesicle synthesis protein GvpL/GvpF
MSAGAIIGVRLGADGALAPVFAPADMPTEPLAHHAAVVAELRRQPMAPLRFGSTMSPQDIPGHGPALRRAAALSTDHVEIGVTLTPRAESMDAAPPVDGRGFLRRAASRHASAQVFEEAVSSLAAALAVLPGVAAIRHLDVAHDRASLALCARRADAPAIAAAAGRMTDAAAVAATGPWPLYSFALAPGEAA